MDHAPTVMVGLLIAGYVSYYLASRQRAAFVFWLLVLCTVPFWWQVTVVSGLPPATIASLIVLPAIIKARPRDQLAMVDRVLIFVIVLAFVTTVLQLSSRHVISAPVLQWVTAYVVGRRLGYACGRHFVSNTVAVAGTAIAVWAIGEYIFQVHVFEHSAITATQGSWAAIQTRGGADRSEASFGHAIALGGFLALTIPFVLTSRYKARLVMIGVIGTGILATLSRGPMLAGLLTALLVVIFFGPRLGAATRLWTSAGGLLALIFIVPMVRDQFFSASDELSSSTQARQYLWKHVPGDLHVFGQASNTQVDLSAVGKAAYRGFESIDSTPLWIGLNFGWAVVGLLAICLAAAAVRVLSRRGSPAELALIGQLPVLATVALITQYGAAVWLVAGLAVAFRDPAQTSPEGVLGRRDVAELGVKVAVVEPVDPLPGSRSRRRPGSATVRGDG